MKHAVKYRLVCFPLELLGSILVAGRHGSKERCFKIPVLTTPDEDQRGRGRVSGRRGGLGT